MNTLQLEFFMKKDNFINKVFGGVLAKDQLSFFTTKKPKAYIVNTDPSNKIGKHWIVIWLDECSTFFNSSGKSPDIDFSKFIIANSEQYRFNTKRLQASDSNLCGQYCLLFCYFKSRNFSFKEILDLFSDNYELNDKIVKYFYDIVFLREMY